MSFEHKSLEEVFMSTVVRADTRTKTKYHGMVKVERENDEVTLSYKGIRYIVEKAEYNGEMFVNITVFNEFDMSVTPIDIAKDDNEDPVMIFEQWVDVGTPSEEEIHSVTGKPYAGKLKDLQRYHRLSR